MDFSKTVNHLKQSFRKQTTKDLKFRSSQLLKFQQMINLNEKKILTALNKDLNKSESEATLTEVLLVKNEVRLMLNNLHKFAQKKKSDKNLVSLFDSVYTRPEPYGTVLIISAWNYPVYLSLMPLIGAIAAGNSAILKPSELAPNTAKLLEELIDKFLDKDYYKVINGGKEDTDRLLNERFDKILFTGSTNVGRIVYQKAAKHLTPCVLELGGKSPCYINDDVLNNLEIVCKRLIFGKLVCLGQTCVAPDYVLCSQKVQEKLLKIFPKIINQQFGENPETSSNLCRIITEHHFERLRKLLESSKEKIVFGGQMNKETKYIAPTVLISIDGNEPIMQEEIFGPILPIKTVNSADEAIDFVNSREKPLTLYVFTENEKIKNRFINETSSGSVCVNDTIIHLSIDNLPFGGVGESGMGSYHGRHSFNTFSHQKSVLEHSWNPIVQLLEMSRYLPPTELKSFVIKELITYRTIMDFKFSSILWFFVGLSSAIFAQFFIR